MISQTEEEYNYAKAMEFGGSPVDWEETWKCPKCKTIFVVNNSNY